jgi:hypothetical protein
MPAVRMTSRKQYIKAIKVLDRVGGTYQGVGFEEKYLLVNEAQYKALVEAGVATGKPESFIRGESRPSNDQTEAKKATPSDAKKEQKRGKRSRKHK